MFILAAKRHLKVLNKTFREVDEAFNCVFTRCSVYLTIVIGLSSSNKLILQYCGYLKGGSYVEIKQEVLNLHGVRTWIKKIGTSDSNSSCRKCFMVTVASMAGVCRAQRGLAGVSRGRPRLTGIGLRPINAVFAAILVRGWEH